MHIIRTADGSDTVEIEERSVTYHSAHGALTESRHVYLDAGLRHLLDQGLKDSVRIFELGFGTGLNAVLTYLATKTQELSVVYHAIEPHPLPSDILSGLNYPTILDINQEFFLSFHDTQPSLGPQFDLRVDQTPWASTELDQAIDLIYLDAFGPRYEITPWAADALSYMYEHMSTGGVLVTFCAQGAFKRHLRACGFHVEALPGPPGKREMTRATKK